VGVSTVVSGVVSGTSGVSSLTVSGSLLSALSQGGDGSSAGVSSTGVSVAAGVSSVVPEISTPLWSISGSSFASSTGAGATSSSYKIKKNLVKSLEIFLLKISELYLKCKKIFSRLYMRFSRKKNKPQSTIQCFY